MRVSLFGGGSDDPRHFRQYGGAVLGMAIDKYVYTTVRRLPPFFEHKHRLVYSRVETVRSEDNFTHPMVRACLTSMRVKHGLEMHYDADLPARSGMGSSSSFAVGLVHALSALKGEMLTKRQLAEAAIHVERELIPETGGWQDQIWAAYGGFNLIDFTAEGFTVSPVVMSRERANELTSSIVLYFTGFSRDAHVVEASKRVGEMSGKLEAMSQMVAEARAVLASPDRSIGEIGLLLNDSWRLKRELSPEVCTPQIDDICSAGLSAGAWGCKLLGAGGGGFVLFLCPHDRKASLRAAMKGKIEINPGVDYDGSKLVIYQPDGW